ncbi:DUF4857 domain-containing protein [Halosquirtibacter laminarini]|uniref:DUF4857 domain-containing protein n=1 Tax=Halosquirtibacter laminarini TaxID=3374600 RepID=A0AC61NQE5_9BACT|nr:DUF4857 domain-containing protein [Prolixibacteraceae bacterium]
MNTFTHIIKRTWVVVLTLLLLWVIPSTLQRLLEEKAYYPFTYFSSIRKEFCTTEIISKNNVERRDESGNTYTTAQFDSIMPLFYYRQLLSKGTMPDSINGYPVSIRSIRTNGFFLRVNSSAIDKPEIPLYPLMEVYTGRMKLEMPDDLFRITNGLEFVDLATNKVNREKSEKFAKALDKYGIQYPVKHCYGNPTTRKSYDEGYFIQDANNHLFHLKMVNSKPFVREVKSVENISIRYFKMYEVGNRSFYGFLFDEENNVYLLTTDHYKLKKLPFKYDQTQEELLIMANPIYWTVQITNKKGRFYHAVDAHSLKVVHHIEQAYELDTWDKFAPILFPFTLKFEKYNSEYKYPRITLGSVWCIMIGAILALITLIIDIRKNRRKLWLKYIWILTTGIAGYISLFLLKRL